MFTAESLIELRQQIEKKYREALQALEILRAYVTDSPIPSAPTSSPARVTVLTTPPEAQSKTTVDRVLAAIAKDYKTVEQLEQELSLPEAAIRAVLYSKSVKANLKRRKDGKKFAFRTKPSVSHNEGKSQSAAALVREVLSGQPSGMKSQEIISAVGTRVALTDNIKKAIGAALYNMKKGGKLSHDEDTGMYVLAKSAGHGRDAA